MKIQVSVEISDNKKYCNSKSGLTECAYLHSFTNKCRIFRAEELKRASYPKVLKCEPCKKASQQAKL